MWYWLIDSLFISHHLLSPLSFLSWILNSNEVNPFWAGLESCRQSVCGGVVAHQIFQNLALTFHLFSCLVSHFFPLGICLYQFYSNMQLSQIFQIMINSLLSSLKPSHLEIGRLPLLRSHFLLHLVRHPSQMNKVLLVRQILHSQRYQ